MKIDNKTQSQRLLELMEVIVENDGKLTKARNWAAHHHLDPRIFTFMKEKGIIERPSMRGAIHWNTKMPDRDMAILVAREFNKWVQARVKHRGIQKDIIEKPNGKKQEKIFVGYRLNIFGLKIRLRKPTLKVEKEYAPF